MLRQMSDAPQLNGARVLIKTLVKMYSSRTNSYVDSGTQWVECVLRDGKWEEWCGNERTRTTGSVYPIGWDYLPDEVQSVS